MTPYDHMMENEMEKKMKNDMETEGLLKPER